MWPRLLLSLSFCCLAPAAVRAQALANRVPGDAVIYVGWAGAEGLGVDAGGNLLTNLIRYVLGGGRGCGGGR